MEVLAEDLLAAAVAAIGLFHAWRCCCPGPRRPESDCTLKLLATERPDEMLVSEPVPPPVDRSRVAVDAIPLSDL